MSRRLPIVILRLALLVALAVTAALLIDYLRPIPAFCQVGSGCEQVRASGFGHLLGIPLPAFGLTAFIVMMALSFALPGTLGRKLLLAGAVVGGVVGAALIGVQAFYLNTFCRLCLIVDSSSLVVAAGALWLRSTPADDAPAKSSPWMWLAASVLAVMAPVAWSQAQPPPPVPPEISSLWVPGKINVVEFADFECPFCRQLHPEMLDVLHAYEGRVHFVRLNMPLASHPDSRNAARAYCCAEEQGKGDRMADALFQAPGLSEAACEEIARAMGLSMPAYQSCVRADATDRHIEEQIARVRAAGMHGLPTVWVGDRVLIGLQAPPALEEAFAAAAGAVHGAGTGASSSAVAWLWALLALGWVGCAGVGAVSLKRSSRMATAPASVAAPATDNVRGGRSGARLPE